MSTERENSRRVGRPTRIAYIVLDPYRSASRALRQATTLQAAGYEVRVFSLAHRHRGGGLAAERGVPVLRLQPGSQRGQHIRGHWENRPRPLAVWKFWSLSRTAVVAWQPDLVHCQGDGALPGAADAAAKLDVPLVYDSAELWRGRKGGKAGVERRYIRRAARVVAASDAAAGWLQERYALGEPVAVVRNTVGALPATSRPIPRLRELIGRADGRIIVYTGPVTRDDGLRAAVDALRSLPDHVLAVVGSTDPAQVHWLRRRMSRSGVADRVGFVHASRTERVIELAAQADFAFVGLEPTCLAHRLALPGELFVAIQAGLPVAASDLPDIAAVLRRYNCGLTFHPGDPADVVRALSGLRADEAPCRAGVALAAAELSWGRERYRLLEMYTALAGLSHLQHQRDRSVVD